MKVVSASQGNPDLDDQLLKGKSLEASEGSPVGRVDLKQVVVEVPQRGRVLNNISVSFQRGDKVGIVGPNGAGKSTMLKMLGKARVGLSWGELEGEHGGWRSLNQ